MNKGKKGNRNSRFSQFKETHSIKMDYLRHLSIFHTCTKHTHKAKKRIPPPAFFFLALSHSANSLSSQLATWDTQNWKPSRRAQAKHENRTRPPWHIRCSSFPRHGGIHVVKAVKTRVRQSLLPPWSPTDPKNPDRTHQRLIPLALQRISFVRNSARKNSALREEFRGAQGEVLRKHLLYNSDLTISYRIVRKTGTGCIHGE